MSNKNILVISPHPNDLEMGMGGTVAKLVVQGVSVVSLVTTEGSGSTALSGFEGNELALLRKEEARIASEILGVQFLIPLPLKDVKSQESSQLEYKNYTEGIIGLNRYRAVFDERHGVHEMQYAEVFIELKI